MNKSNENKGETSRRKFLIAVGLSAGAAGCAGGEETTTTTTTTEDGSDGGSDGGDGNGDGGNDSDGESDGEMQILDKEFRWQSIFPDFTKVHYNPYNATSRIRFMGLELFDRLAKQSQASSEWVPLIAKDWSVTDEKMTVNLNENYSWHNGDPVTAQDIVTKFRLDMHLDYAVADLVSEVTQVDEYTVEFITPKPTNPDILRTRILPTRIDAPHSKFGDALKQLEEASTDDETQEAQKNLTSMEVSEAVGNGPFQFGEVLGPNELRLDRFEGHPAADNINFAHWVLVSKTSTQQMWQELTSDGVDGSDTCGPPQDVFDQIPQHFKEQTPQISGLFGGALAFDHEHPVFGKRKVRQGIAYLLDRSAIQQNVHFARVPVEIPCQIPGNQFGNPSDWLGDRASDFDKYEVNQQKATELFEEAGLTKEGGNWVNSNGNVIETTLKCPPWATWVKGGQTISQTLKQFGLNISFQSKEVASWSADWTNGDFTLIMGTWGGNNLHPYFGLNAVFSSNRELLNYPEEISVPPFGDPSGSEQTINPKQKLQQLAHASDESTAQEHVQELAWAANYDLPTMPVWEKADYPFVSNKGWDLPSKDDPIMHVTHPSYFPVKVGKLQATQ